MAVNYWVEMLVPMEVVATFCLVTNDRDHKKFLDWKAGLDPSLHHKLVIINDFSSSNDTRCRFSRRFRSDL